MTRKVHFRHVHEGIEIMTGERVELSDVICGLHRRLAINVTKPDRDVVEAALPMEQWRWIPRAFQCRTCIQRMCSHDLDWEACATPEMEHAVELLCLALYRCAEETRRNFDRDHRCHFDGTRLVCPAKIGDERKCGRMSIALSCCPHPVWRHAYNGCAECGCGVQWLEHRDRYLDLDPYPGDDPGRLPRGLTIVPLPSDLVVIVGCEAVHPDRRDGHVAKECTGVRITYTPIGLSVLSTDERSQRGNQARAARDLLCALASRQPDGHRVPEGIIAEINRMAQMPTGYVYRGPHGAERGREVSAHTPMTHSLGDAIRRASEEWR